MKKAKKNVPSVTEPKPESVKEPEAAVPEVAVPKQEVPPQVAAEKSVIVSAPLKNILTRINSLTKDDLALINKFGLPIKDFADWMFMMEQTLRQVPSVTEKGIAEELKKSLMADTQTQQAQRSSGNVGGGGTVDLILKAIDKVSSGGGSTVLQEKMESFMGKVLDNALDKMNHPSRFETLLDEELAKSKAKAFAAIVTKEGA